MDEYLDDWACADRQALLGLRRASRDHGRPARGEGKDGKKTTKTEEETLNSRQAIWQRPGQRSSRRRTRSSTHLSHDFQKPLEVIHWNVEGATEFRACSTSAEGGPRLPHAGDGGAGSALREAGVHHRQLRGTSPAVPALPARRGGLFGLPLNVSARCCRKTGSSA